MSDGQVHSINVSNGGVPKRPRAAAAFRSLGVEGDRQDDLRHHGGPERAVSIYSWELIQALQQEGHPISPGSIGENLTVSGIPWSAMTPGAVLEVGTARLELTRYTSPCQKIGPSFINFAFDRVSQKTHPGWSRLYARVIEEGSVRIGDPVRILPADSTT